MPRDHPEIMRHHEGFDFVPGNRSLSAVEVGLVNVMSRETVLRQYVDSVKQDYDYVLLDCRPSLGMLVINALSASDYVLVPVQADYLAAEDMTELVGTVQNIKRQINPKLKIGGVFLTMANETNFHKDIVATYILLDCRLSALRSSMDRKRHRLYEKPVSKMRTRINFSVTVFCFFQEGSQWNTP